MKRASAPTRRATRRPRSGSSALRGDNRSATAPRARLARRVAGAALLGIVVGGMLLFGWALLPQEQPGRSGAVAIDIAAEDERGRVVDELAERGLVTAPLLMKLYLSSWARWAHFAPRTHWLEFGLSPRQLVARLAELETRATTEVTLIEGYQYLQVAERLEQAGVCSKEAFSAAVFDENLLDSLAIAGPSAEGYLFPARYPLALDSDPSDVVRRLVRETRTRLTRLSKTAHPDLARLGFTELDILTLASIVEKETGRGGERARIARVFLNRLLRPEAETMGRLQSDPTAAYGCLLVPVVLASCQGFEKHVTPHMLRDPKNPYNTYRHPGLPPGPIANPGEQAISAVLRPAEGEELYFVADGAGGHRFNLEFEAHKKDVAALRHRRELERAASQEALEGSRD